MGIAARHLWLQNLPPELVPDCGMGLNYMLDKAFIPKCSNYVVVDSENWQVRSLFMYLHTYLI